MFLNSGAGFSQFFVIINILMSFFCHPENQFISHGFVTNSARILPDYENKVDEIHRSFA